MFQDFVEILKTGIKILPEFYKTTLQQGLSKSISKELVSFDSIYKKVEHFLKNCNDIVSYFK